MKNVYLIITLVLLLCFLLMPLLAVSDGGGNTVTSQKNSASNVKLNEVNQIKLFLSKEKKVVTLSVEEYLLGVVAAEMSIDYHDEALKAQTVASFTFAYRKILQSKENSAEYDITDDISLDQAYLDSGGRGKKWGEKQAANEEKLKNIINSVKNQIIVYGSEPILAVYHAVSPGNTETAKNIWGSDYPYLQSENSVGDLLAPDYLSEVKFSADEFKEKISSLGAKAGEDATKYIGDIKKSTAGTVLKITLCGKEFSGVEIRNAFSLRSAAFDLVLKDKEFVFTVMGYGHGVGMSQFGADYLAKQGSKYTEILAAYYRGISIVEI